MAKCLICNARKGKRKCIAADGFVCSQCCGKTRSSDQCAGCSYFKDEKSLRNYRKVPHYAVSEMAKGDVFQDRANVIESALCGFDYEQGQCLDDRTAAGIIELLLDNYHFGDEQIASSKPLVERGFIAVDQAIKEDLSSQRPEEIAKLLGSVHRSITRHDEGRRAYLEFVHDYVGVRVGSGARAMRNLL